MLQADKETCIQIKACFGLENLHFYRYNTAAGPGSMHCKYISDPRNFITEDILDLQFILNALSLQQGKIFFDDIGKVCIGIDQLKIEYLVFKLAGL